MSDPKPFKVIESNVLDLVTEALDEVSTLRGTSGMTSAQMDMLDTAYSQLQDLEDVLLLKNLQRKIVSLKAASEELDVVCARMKRSVESLKNLSKTIDQVAKAVGTLSDIIVKAGAAGII